MTTDYTALFPSFTYDRPADGVLRITFDAPGLNSVSPDAHREIADEWGLVQEGLNELSPNRKPHELRVNQAENTAGASAATASSASTRSRGCRRCMALSLIHI